MHNTVLSTNTRHPLLYSIFSQNGSMPPCQYLQAQKMDGLKVATDTYYVTDSEGNVSTLTSLELF